MLIIIDNESASKSAVRLVNTVLYKDDEATGELIEEFPDAENSQQVFTVPEKG